jgi:hypothetical protein
MCFLTEDYREYRLDKSAQDEVFKLSKRVLYWAVVRAAAITEPNLYPGNVTVEQILDALREK